MTEQGIENSIGKVLVGDTQKNALEFVAYLRASEMLIERFAKGYWADKFYWSIKYKGTTVFYVLINGSYDNNISYDKTEPDGWIIWSDDSDSIRKTVQKPGFSVESKEAVPKTKILEQPPITVTFFAWRSDENNG
jgi:hypothetical protein